MFDDFEDMDDDEPGSAQLAEEEPGVALLPPRETPDSFGHGEVEARLLSLALDGRMPHALIFTGLEGVGKATMAFRLARFLLKGETGGAAADAGPSLFGDALPPPPAPASLYVSSDDRIFRQVASGGHPDLLTIERPFDEKKGRRMGSVPVEEARRVAPFLRMTASADGGWRIVIIDDADTMNRNAQNAILKILEEPPPRALLILIAHNLGALLPTIRSRSRAVPFQALSREVFTDLVRRENPGLPARDIEVIYNIAGGSAGQGLRILREGGLESMGKLMILLAGWKDPDWVEIHQLAETLSRPGQEDGLQAFQDILLWIVSAIMRARATGETLPPPLDNEEIATLMRHYPLAGWIEICENLKSHFDLVAQASLDRKQAVLGAFSVLNRREAA